MSKKFLAIFLALFLTISSTFAGCAGVKDPTNDGEDPTVTDTVAPELSGLDESYKGVKGRRFVLPVPVVTDNMDKNPTYTVQVKDPKSNEIELEEDGGEKAFVPESVGDYFATYHAKDSAGLTSQKSITINVLLNEGPTIVIGDTVVESVGETPVAIQLPVPTITDVTGVAITEYDDSILVDARRPLRRTNIKTMPYPGFPTDMQPQMATVMLRAEGTSKINEGVWDSRFKYTEELTRMGAEISVGGKVATVVGGKQLLGAPVRACDLRAGAAMVIAGLMARGTTTIEDIDHIRRGYEQIVEKFAGLGADIRLVLD